MKAALYASSAALKKSFPWERRFFRPSAAFRTSNYTERRTTPTSATFPTKNNHLLNSGGCFYCVSITCYAYDTTADDIFHTINQRTLWKRDLFLR